MTEITAEFVRQILQYDAQTGEMRWRASKGRRRRVKAGDLAGALRHDGYRFVGIKGKRYPAHRLAWLYVHGVWPTGQIDHIDTNPENNAIANLREATNAQNQFNKPKRVDNTSGRKGVFWRRNRKKWFAQIKVHGKQIYLGSFDEVEAAAVAYQEAAEKLQGEFAHRGVAYWAIR